MYGVEILVSEHDYILRMAKVMKAASLQVMNGRTLEVADFDSMVDFVRNYADKHHHQKEEKILFEYMKKELGKVATNLITHGMLVEHDLGRLYMTQLDQALRNYKQPNPDPSKAYDQVKIDEAKLDIITNTTAYTYLITRHIGKENEVVFTYGEKNLTTESIYAVNEQTKKMENEASSQGIQDKYLTLLKNLEEKYLV